MNKPLQIQKFEVLVVDSDDDAIGMLADIVHHSGHQCEQANTLDHAVLLATAFSPDVVLTSMRLVDSTGYELAIRLSATDATDKILRVLMTGQELQQLSADVIAAFDLIIEKPVSIHALSCLLSEWSNEMSIGYAVDHRTAERQGD